MSLDSSDDRVSDHGAQVVESIEQIEDVEMQDIDSRNDQNPRTPRRQSANTREMVIKREQTSDDSISGDDDSGDETESTKEAANLKSERNDDTPIGDGVPSAYETGNFLGRVPPSYQKPAASDSDSSTDESDSADLTESQLTGAAVKEEIPRKRKTSAVGPESHGLDGSVDAQPRKRARKALNRAYLDLLNQDIKHSDQSLSPVYEKMDERRNLPSSQIGMIVWTCLEKERFFEALGRLGRDNATGIAERIHTKSEMEVRQYMQILQDALTHRRQQTELDPIWLEDFPAAVEISQACCQALEEVADDIARRQERAEIAAEEVEIGPDWLLCQENRKDHEREVGDDMSKAAGLFRTEKLLSLSERFFMNAPDSQGNWHEVDGNTPGMWLTSLDDFYALALTLTRRLVAASHYMAATRIRAELGYRPKVRQFVKEKDVLAAIKSLGVAANKPPLTGCVRRLGLSVYHKPPKPDGESDLEPMSVNDVEDALDIEGPNSAGHLRQQMERIALSSDQSSTSSDSPAESDAESDAGSGSNGSADDADSEEEEEVRAEASEAILYSAVDPPQTKRDRQALHRRIKAEREQERYADAVDMQASFKEELQIWSILGQEPPESLVKPGSPPPGRRLKLSVDAGYTVGKDWRARTKVISEWEAHYMDKV